MITRRAESTDLDQYLPLAAAFHAASPVHSALPFDYEGFTNFFLSSINKPDIGMWIVEEDNIIYGIAGALIYPMYFSPTSRVAQELWWWMLPEARGLGAGKQLYDAIELWAKEQSANALFMIALENDDAPKMERLYKDKGFRPMERTFFREVA